jgi:CubicO group peptidase (beta-lactamase class C family)
MKRKPSNRKVLDGFEPFVSKVMRDWNVPGSAVAVVRNGEIILSRGFGYSNIRSKQKFTPDTICPIASVTKSFTAMAVGMLIDDGKLSLNDRVRDYLPSFELHDKNASEAMVVRDLLCHRTGLPRHDGMWYLTDYSRMDILDRLKHLELSRDFRTTYQYNNLMFLVAGLLIGAVSGSSWEEVVKERILTPLGMNDTTTSITQCMKNPRLATSYREMKGKLRVIEHKVFDNAGPAGAITSTINDMIKWVQFHMNGGVVGRKRLVKAETLAEMHKPQMVNNSPMEYHAETPVQCYGLGWAVSTYRGPKRVQHGGNITGFSTLASFLPDDDVGMFILTNRRGNPIRHIVECNLYDRVLGLDEIPWSRRMKATVRKNEEKQKLDKRAKAKARKKNTKPSHPLRDFLGSYEHAAYGLVSVERKGHSITISHGENRGILKHYHYDVFTMKPDKLYSEYQVQFNAGVEGSIESLAIQLEPTVDPIVFKKTKE